MSESFRVVDTRESEQAASKVGRRLRCRESVAQPEQALAAGMNECLTRPTA